MANLSTAWWDDAETDWSSGAGARVVEVFARAYEEPVVIERLAHAAGVSWEGAPAAGPASLTWRWLLGAAVRERRGLELVAEALADGSDAFRQPLEALAGDRLPAVYAHGGIKHGVEMIPAEHVKQALESVVTDATEPGARPAAGLEAIASPTATLAESGAVIEAFSAAMRRTAMLEREG